MYRTHTGPELPSDIYRLYKLGKIPDHLKHHPKVVCIPKYLACDLPRLEEFPDSGLHRGLEFGSRLSCSQRLYLVVEELITVSSEYSKHVESVILAPERTQSRLGSTNEKLFHNGGWIDEFVVLLPIIYEKSESRLPATLVVFGLVPSPFRSRLLFSIMDSFKETVPEYSRVLLDLLQEPMPPVSQSAVSRLVIEICGRFPYMVHFFRDAFCSIQRFADIVLELVLMEGTFEQFLWNELCLQRESWIKNVRDSRTSGVLVKIVKQYIEKWKHKDNADETRFFQQWSGFAAIVFHWKLHLSEAIIQPLLQAIDPRRLMNPGFSFFVGIWHQLSEIQKSEFLNMLRRVQGTWPESILDLAISHDLGIQLLDPIQILELDSYPGLDGRTVQHNLDAVFQILFDEGVLSVQKMVCNLKTMEPACLAEKIQKMLESNKCFDRGYFDAVFSGLEYAMSCVSWDNLLMTMNLVDRFVFLVSLSPLYLAAIIQSLDCEDLRDTKVKATDIVMLYFLMKLSGITNGYPKENTARAMFLATRAFVNEKIPFRLSVYNSLMFVESLGRQTQQLREVGSKYLDIVLSLFPELASEELFLLREELIGGYPLLDLKWKTEFLFNPHQTICQTMSGLLGHEMHLDGETDKFASWMVNFPRAFSMLAVRDIPNTVWDRLLIMARFVAKAFKARLGSKFEARQEALREIGYRKDHLGNMCLLFDISIAKICLEAIERDSRISSWIDGKIETYRTLPESWKSVFRFIHGQCIDHSGTYLLVLIHQTFRLDLVPWCVFNIPSFHIAGDLLLPLLESMKQHSDPMLSIYVFRKRLVFVMVLSGYLFVKYPLRKHLETARQILSILPVLLRKAGLEHESDDQQLRSDILGALKLFLVAFPSLRTQVP